VGLLATGLAYAGPATPIQDTPLDSKRVALAILTFVLGILCFTPVPFTIITQKFRALCTPFHRSAPSVCSRCL